MEVIQGFTFGVDAVKSLLLMSAVMEKRLKVQEAVDLSRLELIFQVNIQHHVLKTKMFYIQFFSD
jgi:chaperone required for assembly of F1-ATPase